MTTHFKQSGFLKAFLLTAILACSINRAPAQAVVTGMSNSFGVLAGSNVGATASAGSVIGDVGVSPGSAITLGGIVVTGGIYPAVPPATVGHTDAQTAYNQLAGFAVTPVVGVLTGQDLGGKTLAPGVYYFASSAQLTGILTLSGQGQYVFQIGSTLTTASGSSILLTNGADASNVFFQVGSSATLGTGTAFQGTIISFASDTITTGSTVNGHVIALNGAVTLDANAITATTNLIVNATVFDLGASRNEPVSVVTLSNAGSILGTGTSELINTGNYNLQSGTVSAILSGTGSSLNKTTSGTVTLSAANTYTGGTTISAGTLAVTNLSGSATGTGAVAVMSGATLTGNGTIGNVTVNAGGMLSPGSNGVGTLTMSNLTLATNSVSNLEFNGTANDRLTVTGTNGLTLGSGAILDLYQVGTTTPFITLGTYQLIGYVGSVTGTPSSLTVGTTTGGLNYTFSTNGTFLDLTIGLASGPGSWSATGGGNWSNTADWTSGIVATGAGNTAVFGTSITAPATVTLDGNETVGGLTFGNANSYTIAPGTGFLTLDNLGATAVIAVSLGNETISSPVVLTTGGVTAQVSVNTGLTISGNISQTATAGVTKAGLGTLTLSGVNSYTGDTVITGGTLTDGVSNAIPSASNLTVNGTTAVFNLGANHTNTVNVVSLDGNGSIIGTGNSTLTSTGGFQLMNGTVTTILAGNGIALTKTTNGTVTLAGANTFTGATTVSAGTLILSSTGSLAPTDVVNVAAGAVLTVDQNGTIATLNSNGLINGNSTLTATTYNLNNSTLVNTSLGTGTLASNGNVTVNGTLASSIDTIDTGTLTLQQPGLLSPNANVTVSAGSTLVLANGDNTILSLAGNGTIDGSNGILTVVDGFGAFNGTIIGATSTNGTFDSSGNFTIANGLTDSFPNGTMVTGGTLTVNGTLITPNVTVASAGTLGGMGTITGNVINNGTVSPSDPSILTISGNFNENGLLDIEIGGTAGPGVNPNGNDEVVVGGKTIINPVGSILNLQSVNGFSSPARGTTFTFISGAPGSISGHFGSITSNFTNDFLVDLPTGQVIGTGAPLGSNLATNFPGANASQLAQISQLEVAPDQFVGGDLLSLLLSNPSSSTSRILNQSSPEAYAGLTDYGLRVTRSYLKTALGLDPVVDSGNYEVIAGYNHYNGGSDSSQTQADYDLNSNGGILGFRAAVGHHVFLGLFGGGDTGSVKSTYLNSSDAGFVGGLFATVDPLTNHRLLGTASFTYGTLSNQGTRSTPSGASSFSGVDSNSYLGTVGVQYAAIQQPKYSITPEVDLSYGSTSVDGFTETNPVTLEALHVDGQNTDSFRTDFIVNGRYNVTSQIAVTGLFGISHDFENTNRNVTANVANETTAVTVQAPGMGDTDYNVGVGLVYSPVKNLRLQIGYTAGFATQAKMSNTLFIGGSYSW